MHLSGDNPDPRPLSERAQADKSVRLMNDQQIRDATGGAAFSGANYLRNNPDVAADPYWGRNPERHYLAYGKAEGRPYPTGDLPPPATALPPNPYYAIPALPAIPSNLFTQVTPAPASSTVQATPIASPLLPSMFATPTTAYAPALAPAPAAVKSSLPSWAIPAAIGAAALLVAVPLLLKKGPRHAS